MRAESAAEVCDVRYAFPIPEDSYTDSRGTNKGHEEFQKEDNGIIVAFRPYAPIPRMIFI